ncbi:DPP IV N-terminal domain-containing protein [Sphingobacterium sp. N143]|uniref:S9 family peptidase n=1 Tax=Sphingobacterium sp. N143 TaxID=2746727 RepID=UPI002577CC0B|nr:DPP IV N-terminal domain-containing protein [Sphingobacterium sp. N143]MDM1294646.1 DPP IV N-terminal domain-containing protein [Sphingobacterium sp. N143]
MKRIALFFLLASTASSYAQRNLNLEETVFGSRSYAPASIIGASWIPKSNSLSYLDKSYQHLLSKSAASNWTEASLVSKTDLEAALKASIPNETFSLSMFPADYQWRDGNRLLLQVDGKEKVYTVVYNVKSRTIESFIGNDSNGANRELSPDLSKIAYLVDNNISIVDKDGKVTPVTNDTDQGIVNGSDYTHRQEFGIKKGMWWNPQNDRLLYYRKDETMVANYPLPQWDPKITAIKWIKYPMTGQKSEEVSLVVYHTATGQKVTLQTGEKLEQYLTMVTWDPSGKYIYVGVLNRGQNDLKVNKYHAETGALVKTLFEEKATTWVEPENPLTFRPNKADQFLYQSDREGYNQLYLYNTEGKLIKKLGYQDVILETLLDFSADGDKVSYIGVTNNGMDRQLFEVDLKSGKTVQLTKEPGTHKAAVSGDGKYIFDQYSDLTTANKSQIKAVKSAKSTVLINAENPFNGKINNPRIEFVHLTSADGKYPLTGRIIYPNDFDPAKKYPVMYYLYGGSHSQLVSNKWLGGAGYFDMYMAQQGYIVFTMDNRGTNYRGRDFYTATHRKLGQLEMADQMKGIEFLQSKSFVDQERMGIFGWSFGGFMTTSFMLHHNDIFKAAVAGGPVIDWKFYEVMYGERYMDTPQENPDGYKLTSLLNKADQLKGRLLIIHGAQDPVVVQQNSMEFLEACIKAGKQVDYFLYPTHEHNVMGKDRIHMYEKIADYFNQHLKK